MEPPTRCQTERPEDLPSGREPCHEKIKGTGAAVGQSHKLAETKDKTETICDGDACTRRTGVTCRSGTTNHESDGHAPLPPVSLVPLPCVLCPARCARVKSTAAYDVICVPFYPTADECSESLKT